MKDDCPYVMPFFLHGPSLLSQWILFIYWPKENFLALSFPTKIIYLFFSTTALTHLVLCSFVISPFLLDLSCFKPLSWPFQSSLPPFGNFVFFFWSIRQFGDTSYCFLIVDSPRAFSTIPVYWVLASPFVSNLLTIKLQEDWKDEERRV